MLLFPSILEILISFGDYAKTVLLLDISSLKLELKRINKHIKKRKWIP
jgi:hypothetical protein